MSTQGSSSNSQKGGRLLTAETDNARILSSILRTVQFKEHAVCTISEAGLKFSTEQAKCVQANAFLQAAMFQQYDYSAGDQTVFRIDLNALIECLSIFGGTSSGEGRTALKLYYDGCGSPLRLLLEEGGVITDCSIQTLEAEEIIDFNFINANVCNKIIMKSECLKEAFAEMDMSSSVLEIAVSCDHPCLRLATYGDTGTTQFEYPKDSDMMELFECEESQCNKYSLALLKPSIRGLGHSNKVSVRMDRRGFVSLQFMIPADNLVCFVEYLCVPEESDCNTTINDTS